MDYTAVIRTLGTAGSKYQQLLDSLVNQTVPPKQILVYLAENYPIPQETVGVEKYIYVKKGMVAQRALPYVEVSTEYILFLDDDVYIPSEGVELLYQKLVENKAAIIAPDVFHNADRSLKVRIMMFLSGRMLGHRNSVWAYRVLRNAGFSYNSKPVNDVYWSQTNAGPCFFCSKKDFLSAHFEEELWLDETPYALGEDQVLFYKMYRMGLKQLTLFHSGIEHLDASSTITSSDKLQRVVYADWRNKCIFWHRFIYSPEHIYFLKIWDIVCLLYTLLFTLSISLIKCEWELLRIKIKGIRDAVRFIRSVDYKKLSKIK